MRKNAIAVAGLFLFIMLGLMVAAFPSAAGIGLAAGCVVLLILIQSRRMETEAWQILTLVSLTGFVVLNYGFENLTIPLGPLRFLPIGELVMIVALALAALRCHGSVLRRALQNPSIVCILALLLLSLIHLAVDLPNYGMYALRDSTFSFEALFLLLGILWAVRERNVELLGKWLLFLFIVNTIYSYTFPWAEQLQTWSPSSGPFHSVPLLGNYQDLAIYLVAGALFCIWVAPSVVQWPRWVLRVLAVAQLGGLGVLQSRTMFVGIALVLVLLVLLRETKSMAQFLSTVAWAFGALVLALSLLSAGDLKLQGRLGTVDLSSLKKEVKSIWPSSPESAELGHESDRRTWYGEVWDKARSNPQYVLVGVGYGQPLIDFISDTGQPVRQPHNSTLNVFGRLGLVGLSIWLVFLFTLLKRLWRAAHGSRKIKGISPPLFLWLFAFCLLGLLDSMVQPYFEFSHSAVPFFFLMGVALGMNPKEAAERSTPAIGQMNLSLHTAERDRLRTLPW
jgi:O-antigen ligase